ncbi:alpha/beta hydrolase [Paenarthrobacter sp. MMS21-TAE1-1]|uniref:Alpha/beta hydrolase n=1 Tax=Paenarthrobacter aromaticivorans TaxID=2849150 RepID=A0ABS6I2T5_9MICC|nr:alpha/beta hydrolase [Paenarthrobacter sp. MMS21-TAE1-1]
MLLGGASAGACLSAAATVRLRDEGSKQPHGLILAYGTFHAALPPLSPIVRRRTRGLHGIVQFRPETVRRMNLNYAGSTEAMEESHAFPGSHDLTGLPSTLLIDADRDILRASGETFATELSTAGVEVIHNVISDSAHGFLDRPHSPSFRVGITAVTNWLHERSATTAETVQ